MGVYLGANLDRCVAAPGPLDSLPFFVASGRGRFYTGRQPDPILERSACRTPRATIPVFIAADARCFAALSMTSLGGFGNSELPKTVILSVFAKDLASGSENLGSYQNALDQKWWIEKPGKKTFTRVCFRVMQPNGAHNSQTNGSPEPCRVPSDHPLSVGAGQATLVGSLSGVVPAHLVSEGEQIIFAVKPSLWFIVFYSAKTVAVILALVIALSYFPYLRSQDYTYVLKIATALIFLQIFFAVLEWISRLYVLTDRRVIRIRGFFTIDIFEAPLVKIQNTYLIFTIHERVVGLGSILFATAGTGGIEASWQNVNQPLETHELIRSAIRDAHRRWTNGNP